MIEYELHPEYDSAKSFYGKAKVTYGEVTHLYSYDVQVAEISAGEVTVLGDYSATTLRHIKEFLKQNGFKAETKKQILEDHRW